MRTPRLLGLWVHSSPQGTWCWTGDQLFLSLEVMMGATRTRQVDKKAKGSRCGSCTPICTSTPRTCLESSVPLCGPEHTQPPSLRKTVAAVCSPAWFSGPDTNVSRPTQWLPPESAPWLTAQDAEVRLGRWEGPARTHTCGRAHDDIPVQSCYSHSPCSLLLST